MGREESVERLARATRVLVVTGAGVSAESGIPTFRGEGGLWEGFRPEELATPDAFARDPARVWRWYRWRHGICDSARPNPAHRAIREMEDLYPEFLLATQNVDGLHERAGSRRLVELHGSIRRSRCTGCGAREDLSGEPGDADADPVPACSGCGDPLRPDVVWFGETYPEGVLERAAEAAERAEVALVCGTSARVWPPTAIALAAVRSGAYLIEVNPATTDLTPHADAVLSGEAGEMLPALLEEILQRRDRHADPNR